VNGGQRSTQIDPDDRRLIRAERRLPFDDVLVRLSTDKLHRESDLVSDAFRPKGPDDVRVLDLDQTAGLVERFVLFGGNVATTRSRDFQRDLNLQRRIDGAIDDTKRSDADLLDDVKSAPRLGNFFVGAGVAFE